MSKNFIILIIIIISSKFCYSQNKEIERKKNFLKFSAGYITLGAGDILGFSFAFEASRNIVSKPKFALNKFLIGGEFIFENGVINPITYNPTIEDFYRNSFKQVSSSIIWGKISYYPFRSLIDGVNIQIGPTLGYSFRTKESAERTVDALGIAHRKSILYFDNGFTIGYRISVSYEVYLSKKILTGLRLDWSNNNKAEINTLAALKIGYSF